MFQQEILNSELKKTHWIAFMFHNIFTICCPGLCERCCLPKKYIDPEKSGGQLLQDLVGFNDKNIMDGLSDHDLYNFYKKYSKYLMPDTKCI